jgi:hypothetical protein
MGYDVHITRAASWTDSERAPIALDEWLAYARHDPDFELDEDAVMFGDVWFDYRAGRIVVKNPDEDIVEKMVRVARALGANVQGDDRERYGE